MTAYNIVRLRTKKGRQADFEATFKHVLETPAAPGFLKLAVVRVPPTGYCFIGKWESYDALADARPWMIGILDRQRPFLEDLGGGLGVTYAASGNTVFEFDIFADRPRSREPDSPPRAYNIVRQRVKPDRIKEFEDNFRFLDTETPPPELAGFRRFALVNVGVRNYYIVGEWESYDNLAAARPFLLRSLDRQREQLEDLGGGLGHTYAVSGEAVFEFP